MLSPQAAIKPNPLGTPPGLPSAAPPRSSEGPSFAQLLNVQAPPAPARQPAPAPLPPQSAAPAPHEATPSSDASDSPAPAKAAAPAANAKPAGAATAKPAAQNQAKGAADATSTSKTAKLAVEITADDDTSRTEKQGLDEFTALIGLAAPVAATANAAPGSIAPVDAAAAAAAQATLQPVAKAAPADTAAATEPQAAAELPRPGDARGNRHTADTGHAAKADTVSARAADPAGPRVAHGATNAPRDAVAAQDAKQATTPSIATADPALPSFAASLQAASGHGMRAASPASAVSAGIAAPLHSPAFAPEVATRVSLLTVDGVQHAELQLNPADMGPVAVQIVLDGSQAQVSFHAAQATTRHALEQSLPDLAAALQGQGLTLSGGGVFQQAPQQQRDSGDAGADTGAGLAGGRTDGAGRIAGGGSETAATRRTVGLLDTFA